MRKQGSCPKKEIMHETISGARRRERRTAWMDNINTWTGVTKFPVEESIRMTGQRKIEQVRICMMWRTLGSKTAKE